MGKPPHVKIGGFFIIFAGKIQNRQSWRGVDTRVIHYRHDGVSVDRFFIGLIASRRPGRGLFPDREQLEAFETNGTADSNVASVMS